jgi:hypothetical protein
MVFSSGWVCGAASLRRTARPGIDTGQQKKFGETDVLDSWIKSAYI